MDKLKIYAMNKATPELGANYNPDFIEPAVSKLDFDKEKSRADELEAKLLESNQWRTQYVEEFKKMQKRLLAFEGMTFSENQEIKFLKEKLIEAAEMLTGYMVTKRLNTNEIHSFLLSLSEIQQAVEGVE